MSKENNRIALLIDGDNAQSKLIQPILEEMSKYGKVTIRRIYGDWTTQGMNSWKDTLNNYSFNPIQKFNYTTGKNSTDSSLIIDAMDILHDRVVDGFCIVSSDSDYTGLAKRIREDGVFVMGIGEKKTPNAFVQSCEIFTYTENIDPHKQDEQDTQTTTKKAKNSNSKSKLTKFDLDQIDKAFDISANESDNTHISEVGINLRKINPSFDPRAYGFKNLTQLISSLKNYELVDNKVNGINYHLVKKIK